MIKSMRNRIRSLFVVALLMTGFPVRAADYARSRYVDSWLRHPVFGDPSFDAFERIPGNPIHRGAPPFDWPVNGFLFRDPVSGHHYAYVGDYTLGYASKPSRCLLYRSEDGARTWTKLGVVLQGDPTMFDKGGHTPDVSVVYDAGRYHMVYDWGELDFNAEGGLAHAWAERPEGPWHRAPQPITRNTALPKLLGRYQRTYAATLVRRAHDWMILGMMDAAPNAWALFAMTAPQPEGPWSERRLVRHVEQERFHPPLMEFFPAFAHGGFVYAPSTSVALNRNFNVLFRAPIERATDPASWEVAQHGSLWHSDDVEHESFGLWGQTFSGCLEPDGTLRAMFNSRDASGLGTVNLAQRPWKRPLRERGFVLSGHQGPSLTCLRDAFGEFRLDANLNLRGTALLMWDYRGALGPDRPQSDATLHPLARTRFNAVELSPRGWRVIHVDARGSETRLAGGDDVSPTRWKIQLHRDRGGRVVFRNGERELWSGSANTNLGTPEAGVLGLWAGAHSHLSVDEFRVTGKPVPGRLNYLGTEALLGAGQNPGQWQERTNAVFRFGTGFVSKQPQALVKWNATGTRLTLWSPRGPEFGTAEVRVDGKLAAVVDLRAATPTASRPVWSSPVLRGAFHALVLQARDASLPVDSLEVGD
jgi:hypothetical protein